MYSRLALSLKMLFHCFGAVVLAVSLHQLYSWTFLSEDPALPSHLLGKGEGQTAPQDRICNAYAALFQFDAEYHHSPPTLYDLFSITPLRSSTVSQSNLVAHRGLILRNVDAKLTPYYRLRQSTSEGSPIWAKAQRDIATWNKIAVVLLNPQLRTVYEKEVMGVVKTGISLKQALNGLCQKRWERNSGESVA
ncbi:hypothetical protein G7046_g6903 [Stylonectria norvegica]|nr:hypothetical protein G7046_g6903 [Stylonectria norvegica]